MPIEEKTKIEESLADSVRRTKTVLDASRAAKSAASQPEPDVSPRPVTVQPGLTPGPGRGNAR